MAVIIPKVEWMEWDALCWKDVGLFLLQFIFILVITLPFDINDCRIDQLTGVKTIPGWLGIRNTKTLALCLSVVYLAGFGYFLNVITHGMTHQQQWGIFISISLLIIALNIRTLRDSSEVSKWKIMLWYDGSFFWYWLFVMLFTL
jgi:4-hydroxybenzoate polyprenyltransferase